jgi:hypothetical protein
VKPRRGHPGGDAHAAPPRRLDHQPILKSNLDGENRMKKLMLILTAFGVAALAQPSFAQPAAPEQASPVSSYSAPTEKHVKKPKKKKATKSEASAAEPAAASQ